MASNVAPIDRFASEDGQFRRQTSTFRNFITADGEFKPEKGRYILYVNYGCPWANRTLIVRKLKKLEDVIGELVHSSIAYLINLNFCAPSSIEVSYLDITLSDDGWFYSGADSSDEKDPVYGFKLLKELYLKVEPNYSLRYTIPVLFDRKTQTIVNNESSEIIRIFNDFKLDGLATDTPDLYPEALRTEIDGINEWVYGTVNNGVYKTGFATTQEAYEANIIPLFKSLDRLETILADGSREFLVGPGRGTLTEADVRLYVTIARFDVAYHTIFRCNLRTIERGYPNIQRWFLGLYYRPEFKSVTKLDQIKRGYSRLGLRITDKEVIVPIGPEVSWE